jgi:hypothetical protein
LDRNSEGKNRKKLLVFRPKFWRATAVEARYYASPWRYQAALEIVLRSTNALIPAIVAMTT